MAMDLKEIEKHIKEAIPDALIEIQDLAGDGNHYSAIVTSSEFEAYTGGNKTTLAGTTDLGSQTQALMRETPGQTRLVTDPVTGETKLDTQITPTKVEQKDFAPPSSFVSFILDAIILDVSNLMFSFSGITVDVVPSAPAEVVSLFAKHL